LLHSSAPVVFGMVSRTGWRPLDSGTVTFQTGDTHPVQPTEPPNMTWDNTAWPGARWTLTTGIRPSAALPGA